MAKVDTGNAERIDFPENATDADVATFQNDNQMDVDLETYMQGTQHQGGGRHDLNPRGLSSQNFEQEYVDAMDGWHNNATSSEELYAPAPVPQGQNFQRLYGQSENEKGELRRALQAQMDANTQLLERLNSMNQPQLPVQAPINPPAFWQAPQTQTAPQPQYTQYQPAPQSAPTYDLPDFIRKAPDEMVLAGEVNQVLKEQVAPYVYGVQQAAMAAYQQAQLAQRQLFESQKTQMGLTPQREQQILSTKPWLASINDPNAYLNAIRSEMVPANGNGNGNVSYVQQVPQAPQTQRILRRVGYVEGQGNGGNVQENRIDPMAQLQAEWQATLALPLGSKERGDKQRQLLHQLEVKRVSGFRDPNVLT